MSDNQSAVQPGQNNNHTEELLSARLTAVNEVLSHLQDDDDDIVLGGSETPAMAQTIQIGQDTPAQPIPMPQATQPLPAGALPIKQPAAPTPPLPEPPAAGGNSDDSIEQYMADLLARSNGYAAPPASDQPSVIMESPTEVTNGEESEEVEAESPSLEDMAEKRQHSQSEVRNNLSSMRELANMNTRSAIEAHSCKQLASRAILQIGMVAAGLFLSFFQLQAAETINSSSFIGAVAGTTVAILGTFLFFRTTVQLKKSSQVHQTT